MSNLFLPFFVGVDGDGLAMAGAKLYFYETGTSTPKNTYSDSDLDPGNVNANPVVADANGLFGPIYLTSGDYKVTLTDSAGANGKTRDPVPGLGASDTLTTRGDLLTRDASGYVALAIGSATQVLTSDGVDASWETPIIPRSSIQGLTYANNVADATNDIDIAVGSAMDGTNARMLVLSAAITKKLDVVWAVGTNQGGLDTGAIADTDYYIWLIERSDTGVVDVLFSTSSTAPTMPANYNYKRLIGWFKRVSAAIVLFHTYELEGGGIELAWDSPTLDVNLSNTLTTSRRTDAVKVPLTFSVIAKLNIVTADSGATFGTWINCPDHTDLAPSASVAPLANAIEATTALGDLREIWVRTSAAGTIAARAGIATVDTYLVVTVGFRWSRR